MADILRNTGRARRDAAMPHLLAPIDLQVIKAAGVTFATSLLERVIEEQAKGDPSRADSVRAEVQKAIGSNLAAVKPGSPQAAALKAALQSRGLWSQYLEVGIGPDAEVFTKAPLLSALGTGVPIGVRGDSAWNNPEPEVVLAVNSRAQIVGATLGNDVNLRDFEGRSALLLGKSKDNNGSTAIGPFIRLFDATFTLDDVRRADLTLTVSGKRRLRARGCEHDARDQPRPARPGGTDHRDAPVPRWLRAVLRHVVRAHAGSWRPGQRLHPPCGRRGAHPQRAPR